jgi:hypothetical protein
MRGPRMPEEFDQGRVRLARLCEAESGWVLCRGQWYLIVRDPMRKPTAESGEFQRAGTMRAVGSEE